MSKKRYALIAATTASVAMGGLAATPVSAQTLWSGSDGDRCEVWKSNEIRCRWQRSAGIGGTVRMPRSLGIDAVNRTGQPYRLSGALWTSNCGVGGERRSTGEWTLPSGGPTTVTLSQPLTQSGYDLPTGICIEVFLLCGADRCADKVEIKGFGGR